MSEQTTQKVTFTLRGDGITVTYSPSDGTMDGTIDDIVDQFQFGRDEFGRDEIVTTSDDFGILATVRLYTDRASRGHYLTLAVPKVWPPADGNAPVKAIAIISPNYEGGALVGRTVTALDGTVAVTG